MRNIQNQIVPVVHHDIPNEINDIEVPGVISSETSAFLVVLTGFVVALAAALI